MNSSSKPTESDVQAMLDDNRRRERRFRTHYDPRAGRGCCGNRTWAETPLEGLPRARVPRSMLADPEYRPDMAATEWERLRCRHDFEYWAVRCARIKDKLTGRDIPFVLNAPQRLVLQTLEADRTAGRPIRAIILKARQWGGSTLVQMYMAWIQSCIKRNWNSLICAHVKDSAGNIRGMYSKLLANYPPELWEGDKAPAFKSFERALNVREIAGRGSLVAIASSENPEAIRGLDIAMAHLSETAYWASTPRRSPQQLIKSICGSVALIPDSLIVMESTANGVGNYFHREWLRCRSGKGDKSTVFVAWHQIEIYRLRPPRPAEFAASLDAYERQLWQMGLSLSQIYWYRCKRLECQSDEQMKSEYPSTDTEAFINSGSGVFAMEAIEALRRGCRPGIRGEFGALPKDDAFAPGAGNSDGGMDGVTFTPDSRGSAVLWHEAEAGRDYVVSVDIGGRSRTADWSVIAALRRPTDADPKPLVVAQWRGHVDHDILVDRAMAIAAYFNRALLVVESNTLETAYGRGDGGMYLLNRLAREYDNVYCRTAPDSTVESPTCRVGFHTNRATKAMVIAGLVQAVREGLYTERDSAACDELATYEQHPNGSYAAKDGCHDDILMTRAIALHVMRQTDPGPLPGPTPPVRYTW